MNRRKRNEERREKKDEGERGPYETTKSPVQTSKENIPHHLSKRKKKGDYSSRCEQGGKRRKKEENTINDYPDIRTESREGRKGVTF